MEVRWAREALGALLLVCSACGGGGDAARREPEVCSSPPTATAADLKRLPTDIPLSEWGVVSDVMVAKGFVTATVTTDTQIIELFPPVARSLLDAGYETISADNEGFEAEIFFSRGPRTTGNVIMREVACDEVTLKLLYGAPRYRADSKETK